MGDLLHRCDVAGYKISKRHGRRARQAFAASNRDLAWRRGIEKCHHGFGIVGGGFHQRDCTADRNIIEAGGYIIRCRGEAVQTGKPRPVPTGGAGEIYDAHARRHLIGNKGDHILDRKLFALIVLDELIDPDLASIQNFANDGADRLPELEARTSAPRAELDHVAPIIVRRCDDDGLQLPSGSDGFGKCVNLFRADRATHIVRIGINQLRFEQQHPILLGNFILGSEYVEVAEIHQAPILCNASSRNACIGGSDDRTSLSNRQTGTPACTAWL